MIDAHIINGFLYIGFWFFPSDAKPFFHPFSKGYLYVDYTLKLLPPPNITH